MIRAAVCEDEPAARAGLCALIRAQPWPCRIWEYACAADLLAQGQAFDLIFLDIRLGGQGPDGMALARAIRAQGPEDQPVIIFVTGHDQYVFDAFEVGAFQYLLKPVQAEQFSRAFARAAQQLAARPKAPPRDRVLTLRAAGASRSLPLGEIRYIEGCGHKVAVHLGQETFVCYAKLQELEQQLQGRFFRIHKGYLINLEHVAGYTRTQVELTGGEKLLLSKYKTQAFAKAYLQFLKQGDGP